MVCRESRGWPHHAGVSSEEGLQSSGAADSAAVEALSGQGSGDLCGQTTLRSDSQVSMTETKAEVSGLITKEKERCGQLTPRTSGEGKGGPFRYKQSTQARKGLWSGRSEKRGKLKSLRGETPHPQAPALGSSSPEECFFLSLSLSLFVLALK